MLRKKENLILEWFDVLHKLPNDGDKIYFQLFNNNIEVGFFAKYQNSSNIFWFNNDEIDIEFEEEEVAYWCLIPEIKVVL